MALIKDQTATSPPLIAHRFGIAQDGFTPADQTERLEVQRKFRQELYTAAVYLQTNVTESREKSLAMTKLEEALLWAGKAIFAD